MARGYERGNEEKERVRESIDIVNLVSEYVPLRKTGMNYTGLCPFHDDHKDGNFFVFPEKQSFYCFSAGCGSGGDIFSFVQQMELIEFKEALEFLANKAGIKLSRIKKDTSSDRIYEMNEVACDFFQQCLAYSSEAQDYLDKRDLNQDSIKKFRVGFAPGDNRRALSDYLSERKFSKKEQVKAGLVGQGEFSGWYDYFRDRITFPFFNNTGTKILGFGGRILDSEKSDIKYLNTRQSDVFNKGRLLYGLNFAIKSAREQKQLIIVEGYTDAIHSNQEGVENVSATAGTALTEHHLELLGRRQDIETVLCFDGDDAGIRAAVRSSEDIIARPKAKVWILPEGTDPDELFREGKDFRQEVVINKPPFEFLIEQYKKTIDTDTLAGKFEILEKVKPLFLNIQASRRGICLETLAQQVTLTRESVMEMFYEDQNPDDIDTSGYEAYKKTPKNPVTKDQIELDFLKKMLIHFSPDLVNYFSKQGMSIDDFNNSTAKAVYTYITKGEDVVPLMFHSSMPLGKGQMLDELVLNIVETATHNGIILKNVTPIRKFVETLPEEPVKMVDLEFSYLKIKTRQFANNIPRALKRGKSIKDIVRILNESDLKLLD